MYLYPENFEEKIGFSIIKETLTSLCLTDKGKELAWNIKFENDSKIISKKHLQLSEFEKINNFGAEFQKYQYLEEILSFLNNFNTEGLYLLEEELSMMRNFLVNVEHNHSQFYKLEEHLNHLKFLIFENVNCEQVLLKINKIIDKEGKVFKNSSSKLKSIYEKIEDKERQVRKILFSQYEFAKKNGWAGDTEITLRNNRLVFPIIAEHKRKIKGFVHDESQSGKYLYIEPFECFELNNDLSELFIERKKEIEKILMLLTSEISIYKNDFFEWVKRMSTLDFIEAKFLLKRKFNAEIPLTTNSIEEMNWQKAFHPLLFIQYQRENKKIIPLNFSQNNNLMTIISGPNAGGKSVSLKTLGLLQFMFLCGLAVGVNENSKFYIFDKIFIEIGDNQSIDNHLSSYSSHLRNMNFIINNSNYKSMILIDEIGSGTDPQIGGSIAQAMLEQLLFKKSFSVVTTHYGQLKNWANSTNLVQNARMKYDVQKLEPLFELEIGKQGSSFALEVASKSGVSKNLLEKAKKYSKARKEIDVEELQNENEKNKQLLNENILKLAEKEKNLDVLISEYSSIKSLINEQKKEILNQAKLKAHQLIENAGKDIEKTIKTIKESKAEKFKTQKERKKLENLKNDLIEELIKVEKPKESLKLVMGMMVKKINSEITGEIIEINKNKVKINNGILSIWLNINEIEKSILKKLPNMNSKVKTFNTHLYDKQINFKSEINLLAKRGEEAMAEFENWLSDAILLGIKTLRVVHGRGHGILRNLIHQELKSNKNIHHFYHETEQLGGDGVTIVELK